MTPDPTEVKTSDRLAFERTRLAYERTMMAWIRTATSLITFGFAVYKFFQFEIDKSGRTIQGTILSPREFSLAMIGVAVPRSMAAVLAALIATLGVAVFMAVWLGL